MKFISHKDLCLIIPHIGDVESWNLSTFEKLLNKFGDDWYAEGGVWERTEENKEMKAIREKFGGE